MVIVLFKAGVQVPVMPLFDCSGSGGINSPAQIGATAVNVGVAFGFTVIVNFVELAHCPAFGVNVYSVVSVLFKAGVQVPVMPLFDCSGSGLIDSPAQIAATAVNVGVSFGFTVIVKLAELAHCPALGVKVYSVVVVLFKAGVQVPVMPLFDCSGSGLIDSPSQIAVTAVKLGVVFGLTVIVNLAELAHCPVFGVKVYSVVVVLFNPGVQVPSIPLFDCRGNAASRSPVQMGEIALNIGEFDA